MTDEKIDLTEKEIKEYINHWEYIRDSTKSEYCKQLAKRRIEALEMKLNKGDY
jgi:hypothetical protein